VHTQQNKGARKMFKGLGISVTLIAAGMFGLPILFLQLFG
jgi:hypothetical protein